MTNNNQQVLFIGGVHMDLQCRFETPSRRDASNPGKMQIMPGGAGLNAASICAQLGATTGLIGLIGDDTNGQALREELSARAIKDGLQTAAGAKTGLYVSMLEPDGTLAIAFSDLSINEESDCDWLANGSEQELQAGDIWIANTNLPSEALVKLGKIANIRQPSIFAAASVSPGKAGRLLPVLSQLDVLFTNLAEARVLCGDDKLDAPACAKHLMAAGVKSGSLSQGKDELWVWENGELSSFVPITTAKLVDVTGAGDALVGAFAFGLSRNQALMKSAQFALTCASAVIGVNGPYASELKLPSLF